MLTDLPNTRYKKINTTSGLGKKTERGKEIKRENERNVNEAKNSKKRVKVKTIKKAGFKWVTEPQQGQKSLQLGQKIRSHTHTAQELRMSYG